MVSGHLVKGQERTLRSKSTGLLLCSKLTGLDDHNVQNVQASKVFTFKLSRPGGPSHSKYRGLEGHYVQNLVACRAIRFKIDRPRGSLCSKCRNLEDHNI
jgi:hypothetical protein